MSGSTTLPETCPICSHSPVSGEDCTPNKSARLSVKAFLKNEQKKRSKETEAVAQPADTPAEPAPVTEPAADGVPTTGAVESTNGVVNGVTGATNDADVHDGDNALDAQVSMFRSYSCSYTNNAALDFSRSRHNPAYHGGSRRRAG